MLRKFLFILISIILLLVFSISLIKIDKQKSNQTNNNISREIITNFNIIKDNLINDSIEEKENDYKKDIIGKIIINKLNIDKPLYKINSKYNNVDNNITILKNSIPPYEDNSILFIAAHSGTGPIAFFKNLNMLNENDEIKIIYDDKEYNYIVKNYWEQEKNGYINVNKAKEKQLILTTCSPNKEGYQLIVNCILKE